MVTAGPARNTACVVVHGVEMELPVRVLLVDDVAAFRVVARAYLQEIRDVTLIGEAASGDEALVQLERLRPDIVLMDVHMKRGNGLDTARRIKAKAADPLVVLLSSASRGGEMTVGPASAGERPGHARRGHAARHAAERSVVTLLGRQLLVL